MTGESWTPEAFDADPTSDKPNDFLDHYARTSLGYQQYALHSELDVSLVDSQDDLCPIQKRFLLYAHDYYGPDDEELPDDTTTPAHTNRQGAMTGSHTERTTDISTMKQWEQ